MTTNNQKSAVPAFTTFVTALVERCKELEVPVEVREIKNWVCFESTVNKHKFYVPKSQSEMSDCETTLPIAPTVQGYVPLPKENGKITCRFTPDLDLISTEVLPLMTSSQDKLRENRKPAKKGASQEPVVKSGREGTLADIGAE